MSAGTNYYLFQTEGDWSRGGIYSGVTPGRLGLECVSPRGWYASAALDGGAAGTCWHRLRLETEVPEEGQVDLYVMAGEEREETDAWLSAPGVSERDKRALFQRQGKKYTNPFDLPLFSHTGRYLWFWLDFFGSVRARFLKVEFPRVAFVDYLPQLYRRGAKDAFLARFLMAFQSIYVDYEEKLEATPGLFAPEAAPGEYLRWMADWFGLRGAADWTDEALRALLPRAAWLCGRKGTCASIRFLARCRTGEAPMLVEQFDALERESAAEKRATLLRLYGESGRAFTVLVSRAAAPGGEDRRALLRLLRQAAPMDAVCRLAVLPDGLTLDAHCYLGINTRLPPLQARGVGEMELIL